jgi:hypothetical protein
MCSSRTGTEVLIGRYSESSRDAAGGSECLLSHCGKGVSRQHVSIRFEVDDVRGDAFVIECIAKKAISVAGRPLGRGALPYVLGSRTDVTIGEVQ